MERKSRFAEKEAGQSTLTQLDRSFSARKVHQQPELDEDGFQIWQDSDIDKSPKQPTAMQNGRRHLRFPLEDSEKELQNEEAEIPEMYWNDEERDNDFFLDRSGFVPVDKLVAVWVVLPPTSNFTEEEAELFEKKYLEKPKQWGASRQKAHPHDCQKIMHNRPKWAKNCVGESFGSTAA